MVSTRLRQKRQEPVQIFIRHLYSEGNRNVSRLQAWLGLPTADWAHFANIATQYLKLLSDSRGLGLPDRESEAQLLLDACSHGRGVFKGAPSFLFGARNADVVVPPSEHVGWTNLYRATRRLEARLGDDAWRRILARPWCVSRLVRTWETAFMFFEMVAAQRDAAAPLRWIIDPQLDESLPTRRHGSRSVHRSVMRLASKIPPENQATTISECVQRFQCFCYRLERWPWVPVHLYLAVGPWDDDDIQSIERGLDDGAESGLRYVGTLEDKVWTPNGTHDWSPPEFACTFPDEWDMLFFTHSKCMQHMFDVFVENGEAILRTRWSGRAIRLP